MKSLGHLNNSYRINQVGEPKQAECKQKEYGLKVAVLGKKSITSLIK